MLQLTPLYVTAFILQAGNGLLLTLITVRASREGFGATLIGLVGTTYFIGFLFGSLAAIPLIRMVGHIRVFAALAAIAAAGALALVLYVDPYVWMGVRAIMGFCFSGLFTAIESWLNGASTNEDRGRVLGIYSLVDLVAVTGSQLMLPVLGADGFTAIAVTAMLMSLSLVPIALTPTASPAESPSTSASMVEIWRVSPLAFVGCFIIGVTNSAFRTVGPLYAVDIGLGISGMAFFMSCGIAGGAILQMPLGWLSDRTDRRRVMLFATAAASIAGIVLALLPTGNPYVAYAGALLFGAFAMPLYSLSAAHANDFAKSGQYATVSAGLLFMYAIGAAIGPIMGSLAIDRLGPAGLFTFIAIAHASLVAWALVRMAARPTVPQAERVRYRPAIGSTPGPVEFDQRQGAAAPAKVAGP